MIAYTVVCPGCGSHWTIRVHSIVRVMDHWCSVCDAYTGIVQGAGRSA